MTFILCALVLLQPATSPPPAATKAVRGVAITLPDAGRNWFEVTLKRAGEDWEDVLTDRGEAAGCTNCIFAGLPWGGYDFEVVLSRRSAPRVRLLDGDQLVLPEGAGILDEVLLNNFGLHQTF